MPIFKYTDECLEAVREWSGIMSAPSKRNRQRLQGIRVVENGFYEKVFASAHVVTPGLWFLPLVTFGLYSGFKNPVISWHVVVGLYALGLFLWTFYEYLLHRFLFHMSVGNTFERKLNVFMMHGYHHEFTDDKLRLVAPPLMSFPIAVVTSTVYYFVAGPIYFWPLLAGTTTGYLAYDWIHYYTHHFRPTTRLGKFLRRYHMEHHFKDQKTHFGISSPLWDLVFRTYSKPTTASALEIELFGADDAPVQHQQTPQTHSDQISYPPPRAAS